MNLEYSDFYLQNQLDLQYLFNFLILKKVSLIYIGPLKSHSDLEFNHIPFRTDSHPMKQFYSPASDLNDCVDMVSFLDNIESMEYIQKILSCCDGKYVFSDRKTDITNISDITLSLNPKIQDSDLSYQLRIEPPRACFRTTMVSVDNHLEQVSEMNPLYLSFLKSLLEFLLTYTNKDGTISNLEINEMGKPKLEEVILYKKS